MIKYHIFRPYWQNNEMENALENDIDRILTAKLQQREELCCVEVFVNREEKRDTSTKSVYHWRILKCRQLIFSCPYVIATPILGVDNGIYIVMNREIYESGSISELLTKLNLVAKNPIPVSNSTYESCLRYSITARIAPHWNQVGNYLVKGRIFLELDQLHSAVKIDICINDANLFLTINPLKIKLYPTNIKDMNISGPDIKEFQSNPQFKISEVNIGLQRVHVLPSLKKGEIVYISHNLPTTCPYRNYKEIRRHWKNMVGIPS